MPISVLLNRPSKVLSSSKSLLIVVSILLLVTKIQLCYCSISSSSHDASASTTTTTTATSTNQITRQTQQQSQKQRQLQKQSQTFLNGAYITKTDVSSDSFFALDIAEMREENNNGNLDIVKDIFLNGKHVELQNGNKRSIASLSLNAKDNYVDDSLYTLYKETFYDIGYNIENETPGNFDQKSVYVYASTVVTDLFNLDVPGIETYAAVIMIIFMEIHHHLDNIQKLCYNIAVDNNDNNDESLIEEINTSLDKVVALWVGENQPRGNNGEGQLLYNIAENVAKHFSQDDYNNNNYREAYVNMELVDLFNKLQTSINDNNQCSSIGGIADENNNDNSSIDEYNGYILVRYIIRSIRSHMNVPLVQSLLHHIKEEPIVGAGDYVELYTLALIPQIKFCNPMAYYKLLDLMVTSKLTSLEKKNLAISIIQDNYSCFLITCSMVGSYKNGAISICDDNELLDSSNKQMLSSEITPNAASHTGIGYKPTANVRQLSHVVDRDVLHINAYLRNSNTFFANDIYQYGYNSNYYGEVKEDSNNGFLTPLPPIMNYMSLKELATSLHSNDLSHQHDIASKYYNNDANYIDTLIQSILGNTDSELYDTITATRNDDSRAILTSTMFTYVVRNMIMYVNILEKISNSYDKCSAKDTDGAMTLIDEAVALFVGSMYYSDTYGDSSDASSSINDSDDGFLDYIDYDGIFTNKNNKNVVGGQSLYTQAKVLCSFYGTCVTDEGSKINKRMLQDFRTIQSKLQKSGGSPTSSTCNSISLTLNLRFIPGLRVSIVQALVYYATINEFRLTKKSTKSTLDVGSDSAFAAEYILAKSLLPYINDASTDYANEIIKITQFFSDDKEPSSDDIYNDPQESMNELVRIFNKIVKGGVDNNMGNIDDTKFALICDGDFGVLSTNSFDLLSSKTSINDGIVPKDVNVCNDEIPVPTAPVEPAPTPKPIQLPTMVPISPPVMMPALPPESMPAPAPVTMPTAMTPSTVMVPTNPTGDDGNDMNPTAVSPTVMTPTVMTPTNGGMNPTADMPVPIEPEPPVNVNVDNVDLLEDGPYEFTFDVSDVASFALDVKEMSTAFNPLEPYRNGIGGKSTLQELSTESMNMMSTQPIFNIYLYAFKDEKFLYDENGSLQYEGNGDFCDVIIKNILSNSSNGVSPEKAKFAAEAAIVLNVWMRIQSYLFYAIQECKGSGTKAEDNDILKNIDKAAAMFIGNGQIQGKFDAGFSMYNIGQKAIHNFNNMERESDINTNIINLFVEAKNLVATCSSDPINNTIQLRKIVRYIIAHMSASLIANLIYYAKESMLNPATSADEDDAVTAQDFVKLYALAVIPQAIGCSPDVYMSLKNLFIDGTVTADTLPDIYEDINKFLFCLDIPCEDLGDIDEPMFTENCINEHNTHRIIVGYDPKHDVRSHLRSDIDMLQIKIFMEQEAYEPALDWYMNGWNSKFNPDTGHQAYTLHGIATKDSNKKVPVQYQAFKKYHQSDTFADLLILQAIKKEGVFSDATANQRSLAVTKTLQTMVFYMAVLERLYVSINDCRSNEGLEPGAGVETWDYGVAYLVGSIEGKQRGGSASGGGQLLYALAKTMCSNFGTCEGSGDAAVNERLIDSLTNGRTLVEQDECEAALAVITNDIVPVLPVSMIQATLYYATTNEGVSIDSATIAGGYVLANSMLPLVSDVDTSSADVIATNMAFLKPLAAGSSTLVFDAFTDFVPKIGIDCKDIGQDQQERSVCAEDTPTPPDPEETPTSLADGLYVTTTYVKPISNIALDIKEMEEQLEKGNKELAKEIYTEGANSEIYNENGVKVGQRNIASFATALTDSLKKEPLFNVYVNALQDSEGKYMNRSATLYADSIVQAAFETTSAADITLASESAVVFNVWMYTVHLLYETLRNCKEKRIADDEGVHYIDMAVATYIGDGQLTGDAERGHLLYALAEKNGELFGIDEGGQSRTNTNILRLFNEAKNELTFPNACTENPNTYPRLRQIVHKIISQMTIPLIQGLVHNMRTTDKNREKMFALAFVPLTSICTPRWYEFLRNKLLVYDYSAIEANAIYQAVEATYECLGIKCADVGVYKDYPGPACKDHDDLTTMAGYQPETDVRAYSKIDVDISELSILMKMGAYEPANELYKYGKNVVSDNTNGQEVLSLEQMAKSSSRSMIPKFESFERYYESSNYVNKIIQRGLDPSKEPDYSVEERVELVDKGCRYLVVTMAAWASMYQALNDCNSGNSDRTQRALTSWDKTAGFLIGSLDGTRAKGTTDGILLHSLAKEQCKEWNTCSADNAVVNERILTMLYAGRAEIKVGSCSAAEKTVREIEPLIQIPLIQATLHYAIKSHKSNVFNSGSSSLTFSEGYIYSHAILPLVEDANRDAAAVISANYDLDQQQMDGAPPKVDVAAVFKAFSDSFSEMNIDCMMVGYNGGYDACSGKVAPLQSGQGTGGSSMGGGAIAGIVLGSLLGVAIFALLGLLYIQGQRKKLGNGRGKESSVEMAAKSEKASFVRNEDGVMDATADPMVSSTRNNNGNGTTASHDDGDFIDNDANDAESDEKVPIV